MLIENTRISPLDFSVNTFFLLKSIIYWVSTIRCYSLGCNKRQSYCFKFKYWVLPLLFCGNFFVTEDHNIFYQITFKYRSRLKLYFLQLNYNQVLCKNWEKRNQRKYNLKEKLFFEAIIFITYLLLHLYYIHTVTPIFVIFLP